MTWLSELPLGRFTGLCAGLFSSALSLGAAAGPLVLSMTGFGGHTPFHANMIVVALAVTRDRVSLHASV